MTCTVEMRAQAQDIASQLEAQPKIAAVDVLSPTEGPRDEWTIEVIVGRSHVPSQVLLALGAHGLYTEDQTTRSASGTTQIVATVPR